MVCSSFLKVIQEFADLSEVSFPAISGAASHAEFLISIKANLLLFCHQCITKYSPSMNDVTKLGLQQHLSSNQIPWGRGHFPRF